MRHSEKLTLGWFTFVGLCSICACGGTASSALEEASNDGSNQGSGGTMGDADGSGGLSEPPGDEGSGGTSERPGDEASLYEPRDPEVSIVGDGRLQDGSIEENMGHGWDTCYSPHPGVSREGVDAAHGETYLSFRDVSPEMSSDDAPLGEIALWIDDGFEAGELYSVYFEVKDFTGSPADGELSFGFGVGSCDPEGTSQTIPIPELRVGDEWVTRCVDLVPDQDSTYLLLWAQGERFTLGMDALRLGPSCR